jgi:hypothetical protein
MGACLDELQDKMVGVLAALGERSPLDAGTVIPVKKRKLPRKGEVLDPPVQITVSCSDTPDRVRYASFARHWKYYLVYVTVIGPNQQDNVKYLREYAEMRDRLMAPFFKQPGTDLTYPMLGVPGVFDMRVEPLTFMHRGMLANGYDYQQFGVDFTANR